MPFIPGIKFLHYKRPIFYGKKSIEYICIYTFSAPQTNLGDSTSSHRHHKKHKKEKKAKKDKKEKRDKEHHSNGEVVKKHKSKHKEKDRDREAVPAMKLKIKAIPPVDSTGGPPQIIPPIKVCLSQGASNVASSSASSKKRHRQHSDSSDSSMGSLGSSSAPALKMSRVIGTSAEQESTFLAERIGQYGMSKNSRKVNLL